MNQMHIDLIRERARELQDSKPAAIGVGGMVWRVNSWGNVVVGDAIERSPSDRELIILRDWLINLYPPKLFPDRRIK